MKTRLSRIGVALALGGLAAGCAEDPMTAPGPLFDHAVAGNSTVVVHPGNLDGWALQQGLTTAMAQFVNGPGTPPTGIGSVEFQVGADGDDGAQVRTAHFNGVLLSDISALSYSTYVQQNVGGQAAYLIMNVDFDNNGTTDDLLFFEPVYQNGTYSGDPVPNQCGADPACVAIGQWQTWDARNGGWWSLNAFTFGPPLVTLNNYVAAHPGARIAATAAGALRIVAGFGAGSWDNFIGNADNATIGIAGDETTYDFELQAPQPANKDACKKGGWQTLARANGSPFKNQGDCIKYVNTGK